MGIEHRILTSKPVRWPQITALLASHQYPVQMRMIDGQLAFPDEDPPEAWQELRVSTPGGMITLRREADTVKVVTWGNADAKMLEAWNALAWSVATVAIGSIENEQGQRDPAEFGRRERLPFAVS